MSIVTVGWNEDKVPNIFSTNIFGTYVVMLVMIEMIW